MSHARQLAWFGRCASFATLAAAILIMPVMADPPPTLRAGAETNFEPYVAADAQGRATGFAVELLEAVARTVGADIRFESDQWDRIWHKLQVGEIDVLPLVARMPEREGLVEFTRPHTLGYDTFFVRHGQTSVESIEEARTLSIIVLRSDAAHEALLSRGFMDQVVVVDELAQGFRLLASGHHDALLAPILQGNMQLKQLGLRGVIRPGPLVTEYRREFCFATRKGDTALRDRLDQGLAIVKASGEYDRLYRKWVGIYEPRTFPVAWVVTGAASAAGILGLLALWTWSLRRRVAVRTRALTDEIQARTSAELQLLRQQAELEQQVAERTAEVRQSAEETRLFVKHAPIAIAMFDRDMNYLAASDRWVAEHGRGHTDLIGHNLYAIHPDLPETWKRVHRQGLAGATLKKDEDLWHQADGTAQWLRWAVLPWRGPNGQIGGIIISSEDITERKLNEMALVEANRNKDEFLAMLAHELRNPLTPISLAAHVLQHPGLDEKRLQWAVATIADQVKHITRLVDDLLDVSRISRGLIKLKPETVALSDLAAQAAAAVRPTIEAKRHQFVMTMPDEPVFLDVDVVRLTQVLVNLLDNAAKYTRDGGHIELSAKVVEGQIEIAVRDDGPGLSAELLPHVFELFRQGDRTLDRRQGGLGIGLNLAERLVHLHGGKIRAESPGPGKGAVFTVRLPVRAAAPAPAAGQPALPAARAGMRVLVVDDDPRITASLGTVLTLHGYVVRAVHTGIEALSVVPEFEPQAILLDIGLVGIDGYETARRLRALPAGDRFRLIAISGYGTAEAVAKGKTAGFDAHLTKPVEYEQIVAELTPAATETPAAAKP